MLEKFTDYQYLDKYRDLYKKIPWVLLVVYILLYPFLNSRVYAYGAYITIPVIGFGIIGKKEGMIMGAMTVPLNTLLDLMFSDIPVVDTIQNLVFIGMLLAGLGYVVGSYVELTREKNKMIEKMKEQKKEILQLQELIPICMYCKDVRDARGYWGKIEAYLRTHTTSEFSHGICESCYSEQVTSMEDSNPN